MQSLVANEEGPAPGAGLVLSCSLIVLVGMMGAGKTTVGRELARRLKWRFMDCDHEIEARTGVKIPIIFEIEGEEGFRRRESQTLDELTREQGVVLATGGGAVMRPANRALLHERGLVVYLDVPPQVLWERTRHDRSRPLLQCENPRARIDALYRERAPYYREVAHIVIEGGRVNPGAMTRAIEKELAKRCRP